MMVGNKTVVGGLKRPAEGTTSHLSPNVFQTNQLTPKRQRLDGQTAAIAQYLWKQVIASNSEGKVKVDGRSTGGGSGIINFRLIGCGKRQQMASDDRPSNVTNRLRQQTTCNRYVTTSRHRNVSPATSKPSCGDVRGCSCGITVYRSTARHHRNDNAPKDRRQIDAGTRQRVSKKSITDQSNRRPSEISTEKNIEFRAPQQPLTDGDEVSQVVTSHVVCCPSSADTLAAEPESPPVPVTSSGTTETDLCALASDIGRLSVGDQTEASCDIQHLHVGRKMFNTDPTVGIEYLQQHNVIGTTALSVAQFLLNGEGLNKGAIGEFLSEKSQINSEIMAAFVGLHNFTEVDYLQALRRFLCGFRLPGEAQKIDRVLECFAQIYCSSNPNFFRSQDACHSLSFATVMLNTSLHNPNVKDRLTVDSFISINRGQHLTPVFLMQVYESIKTEPFKVPEDSASWELMFPFHNPIKTGWLCKRGGQFKSWKKRWFVLKDKCLYYFQVTTDKMPKGIIPLEKLAVRDVIDRLKPNCFELYSHSTDVIKACKTSWDGRVVQGNHKVFRMSAASADDQQQWIQTLRTITTTSINPLDGKPDHTTVT